MIDENSKGFYDELFWNTESVNQYSLMLVKELVPYIDQHYRTIQTLKAGWILALAFLDILVEYLVSLVSTGLGKGKNGLKN